MAKKKKEEKDKPDKEEGKALKDFQIRINEFGEIITSMPIEQVNEFLNENVDDKKLRDRQGEEE